MTTLTGKVVFISGASRGIGKAIALRAAADGARIVVAAKTVEPHPKLPGTIHTAAEEIRQAGGEALPVQLDIRDGAQVQAAVETAAAHFGGIDVLVNNASAISLTGTLETPLKRFDLMMGVNVRGTFACSQACIPWLRRADNPHVLTLAPPLTLNSRWYRDHVAYTIAKLGMSQCVLGMAEEFRDDGIAFNALWPRTVIDTEALRMLPGGITREMCRRPEIVADAAHAILTRNSRSCSGNFFIDEDVLTEQGVRDFRRYAIGSGEPVSDIFLD